MLDFPDEWRDRERTPIDFIVVGAGAGGAPLASRLVERGYVVLVLEMGPAHPDRPAGAAVEPTDVPLLHPGTTEDERHSLRFFVKHFDQDPAGSQDWKVRRGDGLRRDEQGIFYPRAQGVGGCTIHNAMITVCGPSEDWDEIAEATGDESWRGERMRHYFQRVERCHYARPGLWARLLSLFGWGDGWDDSRHGLEGWLDVTMVDLRFLLRDRMLLAMVLSGLAAMLRCGAERVGDLLRAVLTARLMPGLDPNHWETMRRNRECVTNIPVAVTPNGRRSGARDRLLGLLDSASPHRDRLHLRTGFCVTGLILEDEPGRMPSIRATGVKGLAREHVYEADPRASESDAFAQSDVVQLHCRKEVILCGGTFNTPQLLMLSGIGPETHLRENGIEPRVNLPGVGGNLQDRYEVPIVATLTGRFRSLDGLTLNISNPDPKLRQWIRYPSGSAYRRGLYATPGGLMGLFRRSSEEDVYPDLFVLVVVGTFEGYFLGWSRPEAQLPTIAGDPPGYRRTLTWLILKARTRNRSGYVRLQSGNPLRRPEIHFRSFTPDTPDGRSTDLEALVQGVEFVDAMLQSGEDKGVIQSRGHPGLQSFQGDVREWIRHTAWGHHACGTCRLGAGDDELAVVDSRFRVRGVSGLRVVDASVFPRIPGFFLVSSVYTIAEKAADVLAEDHPIPANRLSDAVKRERDRTPIRPSRPEFQARRTYPAAMESAEAQLIAARRKAARAGGR
jgi:choline dehydrogenase